MLSNLRRDENTRLYFLWKKKFFLEVENLYCVIKCSTKKLALIWTHTHTDGMQLFSSKQAIPISSWKFITVSIATAYNSTQKLHAASTNQIGKFMICTPISTEKKNNIVKPNIDDERIGKWFFFSSSSLSLEIKKNYSSSNREVKWNEECNKLLETGHNNNRTVYNDLFRHGSIFSVFFRVFSRILDYLEEAKKKFLFSILTLGVKWSCCAGNSRVSNLFLFFFIWLFMTFCMCVSFLLQVYGLIREFMTISLFGITNTKNFGKKKQIFVHWECLHLEVDRWCGNKRTGCAIRERKRKRNKMCKQWLNNNKINIEKPKVNDE